MWKLPEKWIVPKEESFYGVKLDIYEHTILEYNYVTPHLKQFRTAIDIGAHIGSTSVRYAKDFETVHSFEPVYTEELEQNTNHLQNIIRYNVALDNENTKKDMVSLTKNSGRTLIIDKDNPPPKYNQLYTVETRTLDSYNISNVDFIKIDTEDYVLPVLEGGHNTLKNNDPILQIEVKNSNKRNDVDRFLNELGYKLYDKFSVERFYKR